MQMGGAKMKRKIIRIDRDKCNGCGLCIPNCHEGALQIVDGKATLVKDSFCDGLGACLGQCPQGALTIEEREAAEFDQSAVEAHKGSNYPPHPEHKVHGHVGCPQGLRHPGFSGTFAPSGGSCHQGLRHPGFSGTFAPSGGSCPGSRIRSMSRPGENTPPAGKSISGTEENPSPTPNDKSQLGHWPVQLMLVPPTAPFLRGAEMVLCADCVPFAFPALHSRYLRGRAVLVGCPKLDDIKFYREKLEDIFRVAKPSRVTVLRMEVPCCGGLAEVAREARDAGFPEMPLEIHIFGIEGEILSRTVA